MPLAGLWVHLGWHGQCHWLACGFISNAIGWLVGSFILFLLRINKNKIFWKDAFISHIYMTTS
jgi:hypothetical protein